MILRYFLQLLGHQEWLRFGIRDRIIRFFHNPDTCQSEIFQVPFFGKKYDGDFSTFIDWSTYYYGAYSKQELIIMRDALKSIENRIVLDIGANIGHHSLFASTIAEQVHSFEPFPEVAKKIKEKISINSIENITLHEFGLGNTNEDLLFSTPCNRNTGTGSFIITKENDNLITLPIRKGDDFIKRLKLKKLDFIKMDIEGFEPQALRGLKNSLETYRPIVFFEWSVNKRGIKSDLKNNFPEKYKIYDFYPDQIIFGIFRKSCYRLIEEENPQNDGNKIAIPEEKIFI